MDAGYGFGQGAGVYGNMSYFSITHKNILKDDYRYYFDVKRAVNDGLGHVEFKVRRKVGRRLNDSPQCYMNSWGGHNCNWDEADDYVEGQGKLFIRYERGEQSYETPTWNFFYHVPKFTYLYGF